MAKKQRLVVGLDVGRSAVKVVARNGVVSEEIIFPAAVMPARAMMPTARLQADAERDTVQIDGQMLWVGETAQSQGWAESVVFNKAKDWYLRKEHAALVKSALARIEARGLPVRDDVLIVVGMPAREYMEHGVDAMCDAVKAVAPHADVMVQPQPMGPFFRHVLNERGELSGYGSPHDLSFAVVEVGRETTDYCTVYKGEIVVSGAGSSAGLGSAIPKLQEFLAERHGFKGLTEPEAELAFTTKTLRYYGKVIDVSREITEAVEQTLVPDMASNIRLLLPEAIARNLTGVLVAGGGAEWVFPALSKEFPHASLIESPRMAVADGFARFGAMTDLVEE